MKLDQDKELKKLLSLVSSKLSTDRRYLEIIDYGELEINAFSITFWIDFKGDENISSVYLKIPKYIFDKHKTGWSVPITNWLQNSNIIKSKYLKTVNADDGIKEIINKQNYSGNIKRAIIAWMIRTWSQQYNMHL